MENLSEIAMFGIFLVCVGFLVWTNVRPLWKQGPRPGGKGPQNGNKKS